MSSTTSIQQDHGEVVVTVAGDGPALLLLHGNGQSRHEFDAVVAALADFTTVAWDMPGHGCSAPLIASSIEGLAAAALVVLDALELDHVVVVGTSIGAFVAAALAELAPERVSGLVLVEAQCRTADWWSEAWPTVETLFGVERQSRAEIQRRFVTPVDASRVRRWNHDRAAAGADEMLEMMDVLRRFDLVACVRGLGAPAVAVYGELGPAVDSAPAIVGGKVQQHVIEGERPLRGDRGRRRARVPRQFLRWEGAAIVRIDIDRDRCIGSENCVRLAPRTFDVDADGIAVVLDAAGHRAGDILHAARSCPVAAIIVVDAVETSDPGKERR